MSYEKLYEKNRNFEGSTLTFGGTWIRQPRHDCPAQ